MSKYIVDGIIKTSEKDTYNQGCDPDTAQVIDIDYKGSANSVSYLIAEVLEMFSAEGYEINSTGDDPNRVDFSVLECTEGSKASSLEIELWKQGSENLYSCNYSFYIYELGAVDVAKELGIYIKGDHNG